jgi:hypothetical protein
MELMIGPWKVVANTHAQKPTNVNRVKLARSNNQKLCLTSASKIF